MEKGGKVKEEVQSILALTLAKAAAIVPGQVLTNEEMTGLVDGLFAVATPNYTPDGKTVLGILTHCYIIKNVKILELNKNKFNTPLFFGRTFVLLKTHLP